MRILTITLVFCAALAVSAPPPQWFFDLADSGERDMDHYLRSHADARNRGVDAPSPLYGPGNPPFGPDGSLCGPGDSMNVLILLVDFSDNVAQTPAVYFDSMGFASDTLSLSSYYGEVSLGQIDIVTIDYPSSTGWQRAPETYSYYVGGNYGWGSYPANSQGMVEDLCELVDPFVDFSLYDNNSDGYVDGVNVMYAGTFDGTPNTIWPHAWSLPGGGREFDGVIVYSFSVQNEYDSSPGDKSAAVFCHEFGHVIGLPDLYDYGYDSFGIGNWGLMSFGVYNGGGWSPAHPCAWSRAALGVVDPVNVTVDGWYGVPSVQESGTVYRLWRNGTAGNEYFLVENRRPIGYDAALPGHGLLIWHVDDAVSNNNNQWYPGYTSHGHYKVALEQADGLWQLEQAQNYGDANDPFPGQPSQNADEFSFWTVPDSRDYNFADTFVEVSSIPESADTIEVFFSVSQTGIEENGGPSPECRLSLRANPVSGFAELVLLHAGGPASLGIYDMTGRKVAGLAEGELPPGSRSFTWNADSVQPGMYFAAYRGCGAMATVRFVLLD